MGNPVPRCPKPWLWKSAIQSVSEGVKKEAVPVDSYLPDFDYLCRTIGGSKVFAKVDIFHAYWQIPLHVESQEVMSIQTRWECFKHSQRVCMDMTSCGKLPRTEFCKGLLTLETTFNEWLPPFFRSIRQPSAIASHFCDPPYRRRITRRTRKKFPIHFREVGFHGTGRWNFLRQWWHSAAERWIPRGFNMNLVKWNQSRRFWRHPRPETCRSLSARPIVCGTPYLASVRRLRHFTI